MSKDGLVEIQCNNFRCYNLITFPLDNAPPFFRCEDCMKKEAYKDD